MSSRSLVFCLALPSVLLGAPASWADAVVGTGSAGSCTEAALTTAVASVNATGGTITFNCGGAASITLTSQKVFQNTGNPNRVYTIDGGGLITLSGGSTTRLFLHTTGTLNIKNITLAAGLAQGAADNASGGAIRSDSLSLNPLPLNLTSVTFISNATALTAPSPPFSPFDYGGGAVFTRFGTVTITSCTFTSNAANNSSGGAIHGRSSTISITGSTFNGNISNGGGFGGAIWGDGLSPGTSATGGSLQIAYTTFTNNTSRNQGGAIGLSMHPGKNESLLLNNVSMTGNQVVDSSGTYLNTRAFGGAMLADSGTITITSSTFANNIAHSNAGGGTGGGIALTSNDSVTITNSTFSNNRAEGTNNEASGGGLLIASTAQPFLITHATIAFNFAGWTGGGLQTSAVSGTLRNTIIANNDAAAFPSPFQDQCSNTLTNGGGVMEFPANNPSCATGVTVANPMLVTPIAGNGGFTPTHLLQAGSPAIDAGACVVGTDQRGIPRPQGPACDLGAVEVVVPTPATDFFTLTPCRRVDTRSGSPLSCGSSTTFTITGGSCGVPSGATAVAANVTVVSPTAQGNLNVFPAGASPPLTAIVNYAAGATRGNNAIIPLNASGQVAARCSPSGTTHVIIDVNGYFQ